MEEQELTQPKTRQDEAAETVPTGNRIGSQNRNITYHKTQSDYALPNE